MINSNVDTIVNFKNGVLSISDTVFETARQLTLDSKYRKVHISEIINTLSTQVKWTQSFGIKEIKQTVSKVLVPLGKGYYLLSVGAVVKATDADGNVSFIAQDFCNYREVMSARAADSLIRKYNKNYNQAGELTLEVVHV